MLSFLSKNLRWIGAGFLLTLFSGFGQTFFISLSNDAFRETFNLTHGGIGLIYSIATLLAAGMFLQMGKWVDVMSEGRVTLIVCAGLAVACAIIAGAQNTTMLFAGFLGLRLFGQSMMSHIAITATGRWFNANRGTSLSFVTLGYPSSQLLMPALAIALLPLIGFRYLWAASAVFILITVLPTLTTLLSKPRTPQGQETEVRLQNTASKNWRRSEVLRDPRFYILMLGMIVAPFMVTAVFFHQLHLIEIKDWTVAQFGLGFAAYAAWQFIANPITGRLIDRFSARALLPFHVLPIGLGLLIAGTLPGVWVIFALLALMSVTAGMSSTIGGALWPELFGLKYLGEIRALTFAVNVVASAAAPLLTGYLIDAGVAFTWQLIAMSLYCLLAALTLWILQPALKRIATKP